MENACNDLNGAKQLNDLELAFVFGKPFNDAYFAKLH
jgi:hypothetical protein